MMTSTSGIAAEKHYTVAEVAQLWGIGKSTVIRIFEDMPGVLRLSMPTLLKSQRKNRPKVMLRIPLSALERAHEQWSRCAGRRAG
jgi:hypothetical protein